MTTEEKRKAIQDECEKFPCNYGCPYINLGFCTQYSSDCAEPEIIDRWYQAMFGDDTTPRIKDSGERREFTTGAVRDIQEGKGRCDLMPLDVIAEQVNSGTMMDDVMGKIYEFTVTNNPIHLYLAVEFFRNMLGCDMPTLLLEVSKHFEEGAKKYGEHNWQKGIPTHCYIDSAVRHYLKWLRGDNDEPHDRAFVWNILCCIWTCTHKPELNDYGKHERLCTDCAEFTWCEQSCGGEVCGRFKIKEGETDA